MGVISPPSLDTLGLSSGGNVLSGGTNSGASNGKLILIFWVVMYSKL